MSSMISDKWKTLLTGKVARNSRICVVLTPFAILFFSSLHTKALQKPSLYQISQCPLIYRLHLYLFSFPKAHFHPISASTAAAKSIVANGLETILTPNGTFISFFILPQPVPSLPQLRRKPFFHTEGWIHWQSKLHLLLPPGAPEALWLHFQLPLPSLRLFHTEDPPGRGRKCNSAMIGFFTWNNSSVHIFFLSSIPCTFSNSAHFFCHNEMDPGNTLVLSVPA